MHRYDVKRHRQYFRTYGRANLMLATELIEIILWYHVLTYLPSELLLIAIYTVSIPFAIYWFANVFEQQQHQKQF